METIIPLEKVRAAVVKMGIEETVESFREFRIRRLGKSTTSVIETNNGIKIFSKCYDPSLYPQIKGYERLEQQLSDDIAMEEPFNYEMSILNVLNKVDKNLAPILYLADQKQKRLFMEFVGDGSLHSRFIEIDKRIYSSEKEIGRSSSEEFISEKKAEIQNFKKQKEYWIGKGLEYIFRFRRVCNDNESLFKEIEITELGKKDEKNLIEDYLLRTLLSSKPKLEDLGGVRSFLKGRGIKIEDYSKELSKYFFKNLAPEEEISLIHGDLGPHHLTSNGKIIDFDEFRRGSYYQDLVRFLKNPYTNPQEKKIPGYLAMYLVREMMNGQGLNNDEVNKLSIEEIVSKIGKERLALSLKRFYDINLREDIHIASVIRKYSATANRVFGGGHPIYSRRKNLTKWRLEDINNILRNLLSDEGRKYLLKDSNSEEVLEKVRTFFEKTGLIKIASDNIFTLFNGKE